MARNNRTILVVGLGRFGSSVATTLDSMGEDVLAVEQLNASDFDTAVVAIGDSVEASVITA